MIQKNMRQITTPLTQMTMPNDNPRDNFEDNNGKMKTQISTIDEHADEIPNYNPDDTPNNNQKTT
jgi:hypothetical protein